MVVSRGWHWSNARRADQSRNPAARRDRGGRRTQDRTDGEHPGVGEPKLELAGSRSAALERAERESGLLSSEADWLLPANFGRSRAIATLPKAIVMTGVMSFPPALPPPFAVGRRSHHRQPGSLQLLLSEKAGGTRSPPQMCLPARFGLSRNCRLRSAKWRSIAVRAASADG